MKIDNAILLSNLFDDLEIGFTLCCTSPYITLVDGKAVIIIRYRDNAITSLLDANLTEIAQKIKKKLGYEVHTEYTGSSIIKLDDLKSGKNMVAIVEKETHEVQQETQHLLRIDNLARALNKPVKEIKIMLARVGAVIYPQEDASEMIEERHFDQIALQWLKDFKGDASQETDADTANNKPAATSKQPKILTKEITIEDIARIKSGKNAGTPNLSEKGIQQTLSNFFSKVRLEDTTLTDAASAFVEGGGEFGMTLRKKLFSAYRKFFPGASIGEIEPKLVAGAKTYLETLATPTETESDQTED